VRGSHGSPFASGRSPATLFAVELRLNRLNVAVRPFTLLLALASVAAVGLVWAQVVITIRNAQPVPTTVRPRAIVWDGKVFQSRAKLSGWLKSLGASYADWSRTHPGARAVLEKLPPVQTTPAATASPPPPKVSVTAPAPASQHAAASAAPAGSRKLGGLFVLVSLVAGGLCVLAAVLPGALRGRRRRPVTLASGRHRQLLFGAGAAIFVGLLVGFTQG
jgi:hypothetical protein